MPFILPQEVRGDTQLPTHAEVVIIGGGIVGVAAALNLAERGVRVCLCEKGVIGGEQSSRNWGWTRQMGRDPAEVPLIIRSVRAWAGMRERIGASVGFRRVGSTYLCRTERQVAGYEAWLGQAREHGIDTHLLSKTELSTMLPGIAGRFIGALHTTTDGVAEPQLAAPTLAQAAQRLGAAIATSCAVRSVETSAGQVSGVVTERGAIACDRVVLAGGSWSRLFARNLGIAVPQLKVLGTVARVEAPDHALPGMAVGGDNFAFRPRADGGFSIAQRNANVAPITPDSFRLLPHYAPSVLKNRQEFRLRLNRDFIDAWRTPTRWAADEQTPFERTRVLDPVPRSRHNRQALGYLADAFPAFSDSRITHEWGCYMDVTPDAVPIIGPVADWPGMYLATGFSGHGFGLGPGAGELVADLVTDAAPCVDPQPFRFERFRKPKA